LPPNSKILRYDVGCSLVLLIDTCSTIVIPKYWNK
jgi:hypothetical protein